MPASELPGLIISAATAGWTVVAALVLLGLTRFIVRFAAEPDREGRSSPVRARRLERDR
jgi:hypothetical protein